MHVEVARQRSPFTGVGRDYAAAARSVAATARYGSGHAYRQGIRSITCPVLLPHGDRDRLVPVAAARAHPAWSLVVLSGAGHAPQLEAPRECAAVITTWLGCSGGSAAAAAVRGRADGRRQDEHAG
ncbi:MAG: alpha/beta fold hydrolase [Streptosporangiaceae bacterium]